MKLCLPHSASEERKRILQAYGAELVMTPGDEGTDGAIRRVRELAAAEPEKYFYPDQYSNPANWQAHYRSTANEIWEQTRRADHAFRGGAGDQRHICRHHAAAEGTESGDSLHQLAAGRALERPGRLEAHGRRRCVRRFTTTRWPMRIWKFRPKKPTAW